MIANADITLYHREYDAQTRLDVWTRTVYQGVSWHGRQAFVVLAVGPQTASAYTVRLVTQEQIAVAVGDIVVRGCCEATDPQQAKRGASAFIVTGVRDNRRGSAGLRHWRIEGV